MSVYKIEVMGAKEATYGTHEDIAKLVKATNAGAKLVLIGQTFINPASISKISREWGGELRSAEDMVDDPDPQILAALGEVNRLEGKELKQLK